MVNRSLYLCADPRDLRFQGRDAGVELLDRQRIEILPGQLHQRIVGLAREKLVQVHARRIAPNACGCQPRGLPPARFPTKRGAMTTLPKTMIAIDPAGAGGPEVLQPVERPLPEPAEGEVLIRVAAAGVNRPDVMQRLGLYPPPAGAPTIPGLEIAGRIVAAGAGADTHLIGREVCALVAGGGYAEYCVAPESLCLPVPEAFSLVEAAAVPETFFTVWTNLFDRGGARRGDHVLVHGGTSGIGTTAILLGRLFGLETIVTAGGPAKCARALEIGAAHAIDYKSQDFVEEVKRITGGRGVNVVLDMIGGDYLPRNIAAMADEGRHVSIAIQRGAKAEISIWNVMARRLVLTGSTLRPRPVAFKAAIAEALRREVWPRLDSGEIRPIIHATFPLTRAAEAHALMEAGEHVGKIVLTVGDTAK
jgi:NADPH2:quinone reductase